MRLLVAEPDAEMNKKISEHLGAIGYDTDSCYDGAAALDMIGPDGYDAVILNIVMPKHGGFDVLRRMRISDNDTPVMLLTGRDSPRERVEGLDMGADDCMVKPVDFNELAARLRVMHRRRKVDTGNVFRVADLIVDCEKVAVTRSGKEIVLSAKEFSMLEYMIRNKGIVLSREKIESNIWSYESEVGSNVVDVYIRYLRRKLDDGYDTKLIHTVRGRGYVLKEPTV